MIGPQDGIRWLVNVNGIVDSRYWMCIGFMTLKLHPQNGVGKLRRTHNQVISVHLEIQPPFSTERANIEHLGFRTVGQNPVCTPSHSKVYITCSIYVSVDTQILLTTHTHR